MCRTSLTFVELYYLRGQSRLLYNFVTFRYDPNPVMASPVDFFLSIAMKRRLVELLFF